jgi:hypothetical protein
MSSSTNPPHPRNSVTLSVNKHGRAAYTSHGIRDTNPEYGALFSRDTGHKCTGYEARYSRDTRHRHGIRDTTFTGYGTRVSRDTRHKKNIRNGLKPLHSKRFRIAKKLTNLYLIFFNLSLILRLIIFTVLQKTT